MKIRTINGVGMMKSCLVLLFCVFFIAPVFAIDDVFSGQYGHNYSTLLNDPVWEITSTKDGFQLTRLTDQNISKIDPLSQDEKDEFWQKMMWDLTSNKKAQCLGDEVQVICYIPNESRQKISWIKNNHSDYFFYDQLLGVIEVFRISQ